MDEWKLGQRRGFGHTFDDRLGQRVKSDKLASKVLALVAAGHRRKNNLNRWRYPHAYGSSIYGPGEERVLVVSQLETQ